MTGSSGYASGARATRSGPTCGHGRASPERRRSSEVASLLGRTVYALGGVRDGLMRKALCYAPRWGEVEFTVPMFDGFMKRWIPELRSIVEQT